MTTIYHSIDECERKLEYSFPQAYREYISNVKKKTFTTSSGRTIRIKNFLSFDEGEQENICKEHQYCNVRFIPFAKDERNNYLCFDRSDNSVVYLSHKHYYYEPLEKSFELFLKRLE